MTPIQQSKAAALFVAHWTGKGYEKGESQIFWTTLLNQIFGIEHPEQFIVFEQQVLQIFGICKQKQKNRPI